LLQRWWPLLSDTERQELTAWLASCDTTPRVRWLREQANHLGKTIT
jgi:hypothetical protein